MHESPESEASLFHVISHAAKMQLFQAELHIAHCAVLGLTKGSDIGQVTEREIGVDKN